MLCIYSHPLVGTAHTDSVAGEPQRRLATQGSIAMRLLRKRRERPRIEPPNTSHPMSSADANVLAYPRASVLPRQADVYDQYVPSRRMEVHGLELNEGEQLARLEKWRGPQYQQLEQRLRHNEKTK